MRGRYFNHRYNFHYAWQRDQSKPTELCNTQRHQRSGLGNTANLQPFSWNSTHRLNSLAKGNVTLPLGGCFGVVLPFSPPAPNPQPKMVWQFIMRNSGSARGQERSLKWSTGNNLPSLDFYLFCFPQKSQADSRRGFSIFATAGKSKRSFPPTNQQPFLGVTCQDNLLLFF